MNLPFLVVTNLEKSSSGDDHYTTIMDGRSSLLNNGDSLVVCVHDLGAGGGFW